MAPGLEEMYENDARRLVERVTKFTDGDSSFDQCMDYVVSNFCYSRFLDVDRHKVQRLCRKLLVHSQKRKADALEFLSRKFVQSEVFKQLNVVNSDLQYSLLCLLIHLADNPTAVGWIGLQEIGDRAAPKEGGEKCDFQWASYLREDEERCEDSHSASGSLSDWSDSDDRKSDGEDAEVSTPGMTQFASRQPMEPWGLCRNEATGRGWLCRHLQSPYWVGISLDSAAPDRHTSSMHLSANLRSRWEDHVQCSNVMHLPPSATVELTERQIMKEALWMLGGTQHLFVFDCVDGTYAAREGIVVSHLTEKCLRRMLATLTTRASALLRLRRFVDKFAFVPTPGSSSQASRFFCRTYQSYASALSSILLDFDRIACSLERIVIGQHESFTLTMLLEHLEPWFDNFDVLMRIHKTVLESEPEGVFLCERACHLLQQLYSSVVASSSEGSDSVTVSFLLSLFLKTLGPFLEIIDSWVTLGRLQDDYGEFPVARNEDVSMSHKNVWETAVVVKCICPSFMDSIFDLLLVTGKSTELLRCLGKLPEVTKCGGQASLRPLYSTFVERVQSELFAVGAKDGGAPGDVATKNDSLGSNFVTESVWKSILATNFNEYLKTSAETLLSVDVTVEKRSPEVSFGGRSPRDVLCYCLSKEISVRCGRTCSVLLQILNEEHGLGDDLLSIRRFWLMEAGDVMFHFYSQVFEKIPRDGVWSEELNLRIILDDVLLTFAPRDASRIAVCLDESVAGRCVRPLNCYDGIRFYARNPWPLSLVVSRSMWHSYDRIFTFLLQVKWAKYALDELRFPELEARIGVSAHLTAIHVTRIKLLHFVNTFHDHTMMTVLCGDPVPRNGSHSLQNVMDEHERHLRLIRERCLLLPSMQVVHEAVGNVLNVAVVFHDFWKGIGPTRTFSLSLLMEVEKELSDCKRLLFGLHQNTSSTWSQRFLLHVESLVSALGDVTRTDPFDRRA